MIKLRSVRMTRKNKRKRRGQILRSAKNYKSKISKITEKKRCEKIRREIYFSLNKKKNLWKIKVWKTADPIWMNK